MMTLLGSGRFWLKAAPYIASVLAVLAFIAWVDHRGYQRGKADMVAKYQPVMDRALLNIRTLQSNQRALSSALDTQNAAVTATKADGDKRVADGKTALSASQKVNKGLSDKAEELRRNAKLKPAVGDPCVMSETLIKAGGV